MGCFWSKISHWAPTWSNGCFEHEIEWFCWSQLVSSFRRFDFIIFNYFINFSIAHWVNIGSDVLEFSELLLFQFSFVFVCFILNPFWYQLVGSESLSIFEVFHHQVSKLGHVSRVLQYYLWSNASGINLKHIFLQYKMVSP